MTADQLRKSILQQAIQGKLVPQDPNDEPASALLERIREEKARLVKEKKIKKEKNPSVIFRGEDNSHYEKFILTGEVKCIDDEIPFELPNGWEWCRLGEVGELINGRAYKKEELLKTGKYRVLRVGNLFTNNEWFYSNLELAKEKYCQAGDLLYAWSASFGPYIWNGPKTIFHYHIWNVRYNQSIVTRDYLYYFLELDKSRIRNSTTGTTMIHISMENMNPRFIPLPPLAEQQRIVAKIEELMPLVEQYGKAQSELNKLNTNIREQLKKSILQYAIEGKLVAQCEEDGTAEDLLQEIQAEKQRLYAEGKLKKKDLTHSTIFRGEDNKYYEQIGKEIVDITEAISFDIPNNWIWTRIGYLFAHNNGKQLNKSNSVGTLMEYITTSNLYWDGFKIENLKSMPFENHEIERYQAIKGDLLVCEGGDIGRSCIWINDYPIMLQNHIHKLRSYSQLCIKYFFYIFYLYKNVGLIGGKGIGIQGFSAKALHNTIVPLPPLKEQERIVEKIDDLLDQIKC